MYSPNLISRVLRHGFTDGGIPHAPSQPLESNKTGSESRDCQTDPRSVDLIEFKVGDSRHLDSFPNPFTVSAVSIGKEAIGGDKSPGRLLYTKIPQNNLRLALSRLLEYIKVQSTVFIFWSEFDRKDFINSSRVDSPPFDTHGYTHPNNADRGFSAFSLSGPSGPTPHVSNDATFGRTWARQ